ncbi:hypothetical protein IFM89_006391 [Coptis chinensis]|uniref:Uncharacterized protein n=1 Tax=Coptis chinensis TaxID=261450 RepID=A0A835HTZ5_9MAGN|nr:hypothetical protein IFM89_006391 [Coptis chinensis]
MMPPSPAFRENNRKENHRRGRSLESGLLIRDKDDDLTLFNEMQTRERDNFLLHSTDDLDDALSTKLRYFSDFKLGISIPVRGESSELLNVDGDKNDYDWMASELCGVPVGVAPETTAYLQTSPLLTPPDTPLFASLDDEFPSINLSHRGRPRSQPIPITRSTTTTKSNRTSRTSASPHRLSPSPRSGSSTFQSRGRTLSAPHSSSTPILRPSTPSRSPSRSTTPNKPSTPALRSSTPTPRRMSTGSSITVASSGRTGTSPVKPSRGNSASPKLHAWQSNMPGFSSEAPPNLRTSLADRPASYVRGSSPASRNGRGLSPASSNGRGLSPVSSSARGLSPASRNGKDSSSKRQSMSPTASRSASSSCSHDRDQFSSQSKGSVASSGDDDIDSLQSFSVSVSDHSAVKKVGTYPSSRPQTFSKKQPRVLSSSAPKRSFDSALRQMDRRSPQNMFRPLLSSVPSTTFYAGKGSSSHRPLVSRNSSVTTSSNASSEQGASFAPDTEGSDHDQEHRETEWGKAPYPDSQDEVFIFDKVDDETVGNVHDEKLDVAPGESESAKSEVKTGEFRNFSQDIASVAVISESASAQDELLEAGAQENTMTCLKCGRKFKVIEPIEEEYSDICPLCIEKGGCFNLSTTETSVVLQGPTVHSELTVKETESFDEFNPEKSVPELPEFTSKTEAMLFRDETNDGKGKSCLSDSSIEKSMEEGEKYFVDQQLLSQMEVGSNQSTSDSVDQQLQHLNAYPSSKVDVSQGVGISLLLKKSSSSKWPVVQGRTFTASSTPLDELSYARDSLNSIRSSIGHGSASTSSSVDLSSSRQTDGRVQRQYSLRKAEVESSRHATNIKSLSCGSSFSGISNHTHHGMGFDMSTSEENFDVSAGKMEFEALEETIADQEKVRDAESDSFMRAVIPEEDKFDRTESSGMMDASGLDVLSRTPSIQLATSLSEDDCISSSNAEEFANKASLSEMEISSINQETFSIEGNTVLNDGISGVELVEDYTHDSSVMVSGNVRMDPECTPGSQNESLSSKIIVDELQELSVSTSPENDVLASESCIKALADDILGMCSPA